MSRNDIFLQNYNDKIINFFPLNYRPDILRGRQQRSAVTRGCVNDVTFACYHSSALPRPINNHSDPLSPPIPSETDWLAIANSSDLLIRGNPSRFWSQCVKLNPQFGGVPGVVCEHCHRTFLPGQISIWYMGTMDKTVCFNGCYFQMTISLASLPTQTY